jgi:hypothetical protein
VIGGEPKVGYVLRYVYDWGPDAGTGSDKERPAVIVLTVRRADGKTLVRVAPVTHRAPDDPTRALELPWATKQRLGLDDDRSWVILDHANEFQWPGPDVRPVPGVLPATIYYGPLPPALFARLRQQLLGLLRAGRVRARLRLE